MSHVHTTWYRLVDGTQADPSEVAPDDKGVLRSKSGIAVAMRDSGVPRTSGARDKQAAVKAPPRAMTPAAGKAAAKDREMKAADDGKGYQTR